jgi:hypothetical protein
MSWRKGDTEYYPGGVNDPHEIAGNTKLQAAYELGKSICEK